MTSLKFYTRYVDNTLLDIRKKCTDILLNKFNSFRKNFKFAIDDFKNWVPHFLDVQICFNGLAIYHKNTKTGQYTNNESLILWKWKILWNTPLIIRVKQMCSRNRLISEINLIKDWTPSNGFPKRITYSII